MMFIDCIFQKRSRGFFKASSRQAPVELLSSTLQLFPFLLSFLYIYMYTIHFINTCIYYIHINVYSIKIQFVYIINGIIFGKLWFFSIFCPCPDWHKKPWVEGSNLRQIFNGAYEFKVDVWARYLEVSAPWDP